MPKKKEATVEEIQKATKALKITSPVFGAWWEGPVLVLVLQFGQVVRFEPTKKGK